MSFVIRITTQAYNKPDSRINVISRKTRYFHIVREICSDSLLLLSCKFPK